MSRRSDSSREHLISGVTPQSDPEAVSPDGDDLSVDTALETRLQSGERVDVTVESRAHGWRLDHYLHRLFPNHSRMQLQRAVESGDIRLNGIVTKPSRRLRVNDRIWVQLSDADGTVIEPENIPLDILYEDDVLVVVNKPSGMVVHPGRGSSRGTLASALQYHFNSLSNVAGQHRPGIVHRLDRDTTGVILIAKDNQIHQKLSRQFEQRQVRKEYRAVVRGVPEITCDSIKTYICTHHRIREKMMVCTEGGNAREAETFYRVGEDFGRYALMELHPHTGRTHQLRVHMLHIATPIVADRLYIGQSALLKSEITGRSSDEREAGRTHRRVPVSSVGEESIQSDDVLIARQALHAYRLTIRHPVSGEEVQFEAPLPEDFTRTVEFLRQHGRREH